MIMANLLILSTKHMRPETDAELRTKTMTELPFAGGHVPFGYFLYAHEETNGEIPADIWAVCQYARKMGCDYIKFDADGPEILGLSRYDWSKRHDASPKSPGSELPKPPIPRDAIITHLRLIARLLEDAMENHIYDGANGEEPPEDCDFARGLARTRALISQISGNRAD